MHNSNKKAVKQNYFQQQLDRLDIDSKMGFDEDDFKVSRRSSSLE